jgi:anti-sigma regulatory factor (Ser/Thr protein kinase)
MFNDRCEVAVPEKYFLARPQSVSEAREFVATALRGVAVDHDDAAILTSEVASNAVRHADSDFRIRIESTEDRVRIEVINDSPELLLIKKQPSRDGGWGLRLLDQLARDWGVEARPDEKTVWFELKCGAPRPGEYVIS